MEKREGSLVELGYIGRPGWLAHTPAGWQGQAEQRCGLALTASKGHSAMSAMSSAEAEPARKMRFWYFFAFSGPARSE